MREALLASTRSLLLTGSILISSAVQSLAYYHPDEGRWLSRDPAEEVGGGNLYAYVSNDPLDQSDSYGLWSWENDPPNKVFIYGGWIDWKILAFHAHIENMRHNVEELGYRAVVNHHATAADMRAAFKADYVQGFVSYGHGEAGAIIGYGFPGEKKAKAKGFDWESVRRIVTEPWEFVRQDFGEAETFETFKKRIVLHPPR